MMAPSCRGHRPAVPCGMGADPYGVVNTYPGMPGSSSPSWWQTLISGAAGTAEQVLLQKNLARGVYTQTTAQGTTTYVQPAGTSQNVFGATGATATASPGVGIVLIGGAALLLVFMMAKGRG